MKANHTLSAFIAIGMMLVTQPVFGQELSREELNFFEAKIRPVLIKECYGCHSAKTGATKGGLMVDTKEALAMGGDSGPSIVPGDLDESLLWSAINHEDYNMPPGKMLSDKVIADFKTWIEMGAPDPRVMKITEVNSEINKEDIKKGREFWAFKKPEKPAAPKLKKQNWAESEIDQFVLAKLEENELEPAADADAETVLRRLTFALVGLPPTPKQVTWMKKKYPRDPQGAIEKVVDELLAKPQFGERWGRHWLDIARYGESSGREVNLTFPNAWRYRDYVIDSFNEDKPYDRFVQEQIAGDLLPVKTDEQWSENLVATGFLALGPKTLAEQNGRQFRLDLIDEQVDVASRAVLGVSVACARCHDHKFDPIPQSDYYAMSGIFENTATHYGTIDTLQNRRPSNLILLPVDDPQLKEKKLSRRELQALKDKLEQVNIEYEKAVKARRQLRKNGETGNAQTVRNVARSSAQRAAMIAKIASYDSNGNPHTYAMGVQEVDELVETRLLGRGEFDQLGQVVERSFPQVLCDEPVELNPKSSGRLELARWMGSDANPLTARVMVNRIWLHMMGQAIVRTPENFGATGQSPTHPELLDYLAIKFAEENWSVKTIVREIALSHVFRTGSQFRETAFNTDPTNEFLWRFEPRRLDAESLRDSILTVSGQLDKRRPYSSLAAGAGEGLVRDGTIFAVSDNTNSGGGSNSMRSRNGRRKMQQGKSMAEMAVERAGGSVTKLDQPVTYRSVYLPIVRDNIARSLEVFDFAESSMIIGTRESSHTPDQGLYFLNNDFVIEQSQRFARRLMDEHADVESQVRGAFLWAYGREATAGELSAAREFYENFEVPRGLQRGGNESVLKKLSALCQGILASAEFRILN